MGVYGGNIGPRMPKVNGETCLNCGGAFIMQPGLVEKDGVKMVQWRCGCGREELWPAPYSMQGGGKEETSRDLME